MTTRNIERRALGWIATIGAVVAVPLGLSAGTASAAPHDWDGVAECESGGDWTTDTGNGFYGGLQFLPSTWEAHGGKGVPSEAGKAEQIRVAENVLKTQGPGAWPVCGQYLKPGSGVEPAQEPESTPTPELHDPAEESLPVEESAPVEDSGTAEESSPAEDSATVKAAAQEALDNARRLAQQNGSGEVFEQRVAASR
ncbi:MAG: transglycosylase family protein [Rhodococcus sp. (in: high G+C Gram-positive bacteria)]|uniref:transglycosylase family protein n=1 Tax=Rhodococcus sp. TaxID=1831 RepID=UPI003BAF7ED5